jgi:hypothetical protein
MIIEGLNPIIQNLEVDQIVHGLIDIASVLVSKIKILGGNGHREHIAMQHPITTYTFLGGNGQTGHIATQHPITTYKFLRRNQLLGGIKVIASQFRLINEAV